VPQPSRELLEAAIEGKRWALERLIQDQQNYIYSVALGVARNADDAADVMQEACIKMARALPSYRAEARFTTWLFRLVVNVGLDLLRKRGRCVSLEKEEWAEVLLPAVDPSGNPASSAERADAAARVRLALENLPAGQRLALTLQYFEDMHYEEIADIMGVPLNTVKSHIRRGKEALARELGDLAPSVA
jgi:RNA polymerase sigma-70 factor (ECF subfamily)